MSTFDPLWVPLLTHYAAGDEARLDATRTEGQIRHVTPWVRQYLVAGTTGDGWQMSDAVLDDWIALLQRSEVVSARHRVLLGAFGPTTDAVIERAQRIERAIAARPLRAEYAGITVCAPVSETASQDEIAAHLEAILEATTSPLAIYQLPQVVGCEIAPETMATLAGSTDRITLFKDTSGTDRVAKSGVDLGAVRLLRGAEGSYAAHLAPHGWYDGWLLSTANGLAPQLRTIADAVAGARYDEADTASSRLTALVDALFAAAADLPTGNPFSNANRAVDHLLAHGPDWRATPARLVSGDVLPEAFLATVERLLRDSGIEIGGGYRSA